MRAALCILGQLFRLELESKVRFLQTHANVDVFVVLQTEHRMYSRTLASGPTLPPCRQLRTSRASIRPLRPVHTTWTSDSHLMMADLLKRRIDTRRYRTHELFTLHMNQYQNWRQCALDIESYELLHGFRYDHVMRLRENSIVSNASLLTDVMLRDECSTKACNSWGGLHDKVMSCPRRFMQPMLRDISERLLFSHARYAEDINTETALARTLKDARVPVRELPWFPTYDARPCACNDTHVLKWCAVGPKKDCIPELRVK